MSTPRFIVRVWVEGADVSATWKLKTKMGNTQETLEQLTHEIRSIDLTRFVTNIDAMRAHEAWLEHMKKQFDY